MGLLLVFSTSKMAATKTFFIFNLVEKLSDILKPVTSVGMTFLRLLFVVIGGKVETFCLIWGIYAIFEKNKKIADSS